MPIDIVESFITRAANDKLIGSELVRWLKAELKAGNANRLAEILPRLTVPGLDYTTALSLHRVLKQIRSANPQRGRPTRIAVLGTVTTHQLVDLLDLYLQSGRIEAEFYEADFGIVSQEFLDPTSHLRRFRPHLAVICTSWRDLKFRPALSDDSAEVARKAHAEVSSWAAIWRVAKDEMHCQIIQSNFASPPWRTLGNLESHHPAGLSRYVSLVNRTLEDTSFAEVTIHDVDRLAAESGRWEWSDERFFYQAKLPCSPEHLVDYAHSLASLILAQLGAARKCLVLDLDNTLWGGVIGDDGLAGIRVGQGDPEGEAFAAFQRYVKSLGERGVILAVCSKNNEQIAREVFEKHPEMVLRLDDFSCFVANWDNKPANLARIAEQLGIGLNSLVFFDDNPAERSIIRQLQPQVAVPELPDDPAYRIRALDRHRYFEPLTLSAEDMKRREFYRANSERQTLETSFANIDEFLRSLEMEAKVEPVVAFSVERAVQLINRSNQFNLTTKRYTNADLLEFIASPKWITRTVSLSDRFGDNGLISVLLARLESKSLIIDTWLMSCRVLKRGVEALLINHLVEHSLSIGVHRLIGEYIPTPKNSLVSDHYLSLGFTQVTCHADGHSLWELRVDDQWRARQHFIKGSA